MRWTFEMAIGAISDHKLHGFLRRLRGGFGIAERCSELTIRKFKVSLKTKETVRGDGNIELTENEFIRYQSRMIECVDAVTIEEAREISEGLDTDQDRAEDARPRRASRARKRPRTDDFLYYYD